MYLLQVFPHGFYAQECQTYGEPKIYELLADITLSSEAPSDGEPLVNESVNQELNATDSQNYHIATNHQYNLAARREQHG